MLSRNPVEVSRVGDIPKIALLKQMAVTDELRRLTTEEGTHVHSGSKVLEKGYSLRRDEKGTFPHVAERLMPRNHAAIVEVSCSKCTMDHRTGKEQYVRFSCVCGNGYSR